jgi:hypothetical protein
MKGSVLSIPLLGMVRATHLLYSYIIELTIGAHPTSSGFVSVHVMIKFPLEKRSLPLGKPEE